MTRRRHRALATLTVALMMGAGGVVVASPASAAMFPSVSTETELLTALATANTNGEADVITLTGSGFSLTGALPDIEEPLTIIGPGSDTFILNAAGNETLSFFEATSGAVSGITILNSGGTGIVASGTDLIVDDVVVTGSIFSGLSSSSANLTVTNSAFNDNEYGVDVLFDAGHSLTMHDVTATQNQYVGISIFKSGVGGTVSVDTVTASNNSSNGFVLNFDGDDDASVSNVTTHLNGGRGQIFAVGGNSVLTVSGTNSRLNDDVGIVASATNGATLTLTGAWVAENGLTGIDIEAYQVGTVNVLLSTIEENGERGISITADGEAGADSTVIIDRSTIRANGTLGQNSVDGGGIYIEDPDGMDIMVSNSTISGNEAVLGGGIFATFGGSMSGFTLVNSTVSSNTAMFVGGVYFEEMHSDGLASILNSTIVENIGTTAGPSGVGVSDIPFEIRNSIIAGNVDGPGFSGEHFGDLEGFSVDGSIDYSLIQDADASVGAVIAAGTGNLTGVGAQLGPLADNGGPTLTHLPQVGSPVIGAGDPAFSGLTADQRGSVRVIAVLDIGAVESPALLAATGPEPAAPLWGAVLLLALGGVLLAGARRTARRAHG